MDFLIGWALILLTVAVFAAVVHLSGPREKARPNCGDDVGSDGPRRGCH